MINEVVTVNIEGKTITGVKFSCGEFDESRILVNLTPHTLNIITDTVIVDSWMRPDGPDEIIGSTEIVIPPSGVITRIQEVQSREDERFLGQGIGLTKLRFGKPINLPEKQKGVVYIVSRIVAQHLSTRADVFCPGELIRNNDGNIIGCNGLAHF